MRTSPIAVVAAIAAFGAYPARADAQCRGIVGCAFEVLLAPVEATERIVEGTAIGVETLGDTMTAALETPSDPGAVGRALAAPALGTGRILEKAAQTVEAGVVVPLAAGAEAVVQTVDPRRPQYGPYREFGPYRPPRPYKYGTYPNPRSVPMRGVQGRGRDWPAQEHGARMLEHEQRMQEHRQRMRGASAASAADAGAPAADAGAPAADAGAQP